MRPFVDDCPSPPPPRAPLAVRPVASFHRVAHCPLVSLPDRCTLAGTGPLLGAAHRLRCLAHPSRRTPPRRCHAGTGLASHASLGYIGPGTYRSGRGVRRVQGDWYRTASDSVGTDRGATQADTDTRQVRAAILAKESICRRGDCCRSGGDIPVPAASSAGTPRRHQQRADRQGTSLAVATASNPDYGGDVVDARRVPNARACAARVCAARASAPPKPARRRSCRFAAHPRSPQPTPAPTEDRGASHASARKTAGASAACARGDALAHRGPSDKSARADCRDLHPDCRDLHRGRRQSVRPHPHRVDSSVRVKAVRLNAPSLSQLESPSLAGCDRRERDARCPIAPLPLALPRASFARRSRAASARLPPLCHCSPWQTVQFTPGDPAEWPVRKYGEPWHRTNAIGPGGSTAAVVCGKDLGDRRNALPALGRPGRSTRAPTQSGGPALPVPRRSRASAKFRARQSLIVWSVLARQDLANALQPICRHVHQAVDRS